VNVTAVAAHVPQHEFAWNAIDGHYRQHAIFREAANAVHWHEQHRADDDLPEE
jgi:hypothetical protein